MMKNMTTRIALVLTFFLVVVGSLAIPAQATGEEPPGTPEAPIEIGDEDPWAYEEPTADEENDVVITPSAYCRNQVYYQDVDPNLTVRATLYLCDYGSYELIHRVYFTWSDTDTRKLYDNGTEDVNIRKNCWNSSTGSMQWYNLINRSTYYKNTWYYVDSAKKRCNESYSGTARWSTDLTADIFGPDGNYNEYGNL
jgi:hypothetical protein